MHRKAQTPTAANHEMWEGADESSGRIRYCHHLSEKDIITMMIIRGHVGGNCGSLNGLKMA